MIRLRHDLPFFCLICLTVASAACGGSSRSVSDPATWTIALSQSSSFAPNGSGQYSIGVTNSGSAAANGTVTVTDVLPGNGVFTATSLSGTGWTCTLSTVSCSRSDALAAGGSYPQITLAVSVSSNASGTVTDQATVSGGGLSAATTSVQTQIVAPGPWTINIVPSGSFAPGGSGQYSISVTNGSLAATSGNVTVTDTLPGNGALTATSLSGPGWACTLSTLSCSRSDALAAGGSYPQITLAVSVASNASGTVTDQATVSGGGPTEATTSVQTQIVALGAWTINIVPSGSFAPNGSGQYSILATNGGSAATNSAVTVTDTLPGSGALTATSLSGTGWTCTLSTVSCSRSDALAAGNSYPQITLVVSVASNASGTVTDQATVSGGGLTDGSATVQTPIVAPGKIQHVVIIFQENRSTDNLFHDTVLINRGADIASIGQSTNGPVTLTPVSLIGNYDMTHGHASFLSSCDWNGTTCEMDGENLVGCSPAANCPADAGYQYVQPSDVQPYFTMAETYAFGDRMFQTNQGASFPAHQYILSGSSAMCVPGGACPKDTTSTFYVAGNPGADTRADGTPGAGCLNPPGGIVNIIDTSQPFPNSTTINLGGSECFEHPTLTDLLEGASLNWKYYAASDGSIWTAPDAIQHICEPSGPEDQLACGGSDWASHVVLEGTGSQIVTDIQNGQLPAVTWVVPDGAASDHAGENSGLGPSWVASIVNAIGQSQLWSSSAIIVTWDDWGGWYDHVAPPIRNTIAPFNSYEYGFRVPLIVISPYAKAGYVSHQMSDFGSILKFIEETFSLTTTIGESAGVEYADSYALGDLSDFFNFDQPPLTFTPIPADKDAKFFQNRKEKPSPPDND